MPNVYAILGSSLDLVSDLSTQEVFEEQLTPNMVYATLNGAMKALEGEIAEYAADDAQNGPIDLPLTVEWKARTTPVPVGRSITGRVWETENPYTEETLQIHELVLGE